MLLRQHAQYAIVIERVTAKKNKTALEAFFFFERMTFKMSARSGYQSRYVDARLIVQKEVSSWLVYGSNKNNCIGPLDCEGLEGLSSPSSFHMLSIGSLPNAYVREIRQSIR